MTSFAHMLITTFADWRKDNAARRRAAFTRRYLASLPGHIQKDIGWPDENARLEIQPVEKAKCDAEALLARAACPL